MRKQTFSVSASTLKSTLESIVRTGFANRVVVRKNGNVLLDLPIGVLGFAAMMAPLLAGLSFAVVFVQKYEVDVYHK